MTRNPALFRAPGQLAAMRSVGLRTTDDSLVAAMRRYAPEILWVRGDDTMGDLLVIDRAIDSIAHVVARGITVIALVDNAGQASAAIAAGARGVLLRAQCADGISAAIAAVRRGLQVVDLDFVQLGPTPPTTAVDRGNLTEREYQVVQLLAEGLSNKLIADRLGISDHTAKFHVNGVMAKLSASTRTEAVVAAVRRGLVKV